MDNIYDVWMKVEACRDNQLGTNIFLMRGKETEFFSFFFFFDLGKRRVWCILEEKYEKKKIIGIHNRIREPLLLSSLLKFGMVLFACLVLMCVCILNFYRDEEKKMGNLVKEDFGCLYQTNTLVKNCVVGEYLFIFCNFYLKTY